MNYYLPHRIVVHRMINEFEVEIDFNHELSDGFGIPAVVVACPLEVKLKKYSGYDEYGNKVIGISFDECTNCSYFNGLGFGQEINCLYPKNERCKVNKGSGLHA